MFRSQSRIFNLSIISFVILTAFSQTGRANTPYWTDDLNEWSFTCNPPSTFPAGTGVNGNLIYAHSGCPTPPQGPSEGVSATTMDGGSRIQTLSIPTGAQQEVRAKLKFASPGGGYVIYLSSSTSTWYKPTGSSTGGGYAVFVRPAGTAHANGTFPSFYSLHKVQSGYAHQLAGGSIDISPNAVVRAVRTKIGTTWKILLFVDDVFVSSVVDSTFTTSGSSTGKPGFGAFQSTNSDLIDEVSYYAIEHGVPDYNTLNTSLLTGATPNQVMLQWSPTTDTNGGSSYGAAGMAFYEVYRNGTLRTRIKHQSATMLYTDTGLTPGQTYDYILRAVDFHGNFTDVTRSIATPASSPTISSTLPRRVGLPNLGSSWGSGGENIDLLSGNLNITVPILSVMGRGGYAVPLMLNYNSQNWMQTSGATAQHSAYQGVGYGWRLQFGSIRPILLGATISHYVFEDTTGAEYPLDIASGSLWRPSRFSPVLEYDVATNRLWFKDGSFWQMDCVSASGEPDKDARYPTLLQDPNGNQIYVRYQVGKNASWANSSSRIDEIEDVRAVDLGSTRRTYRFQYLLDQNDPSLPSRLYEISLQSGLTTETTTFAHSGIVSLKSPFTGVAIGLNVRMLTGITRSAGGATAFQYAANDSGEMLKMTFPYGGSADYAYATETYSTSTIRAVTSRVLTPTAGGTSYTYGITRSGSGSIPSTTRVIDASNASDKLWTFNTDSASLYYGLWVQLDERAMPYLSVKRRQVPSYDFHPPAKVFIKSVDTTMDPGTANAITGRSGQWLDGYGNLEKSYGYSYTDLVNPARELRFTYAHNLTYGGYGYFDDNRLFDRLHKVELKNGASWITLRQTEYGNAIAPGMSCSAYLKNFATSTHCTGGPLRGNVASVSASGQTVYFEYDLTGNRTRTWGASPEIAGSFGSGTNFTLPDVITPNNTPSLATSFTYNADLRATQTTAPNSATAQQTYDAYGRVLTTTSAAGGVSSYTYGIDTGSRIDTVKTYPSSASADFTFARSYYDGLGRPIKSESGGSDWAVKTITETEYEPCACSPTGKMKRVSLPYAPGGTVQWTTYTYDALGRTLSVALPGGSGATTYEYVKNTVRITDAAGKWKKYETDGLGQLVKVFEPNPAGGADLETTYAYTIRGQLHTATMTRGGDTQVRTFVYNATTGRLESVTKPETGTTTYAYNTDGTVLHTIDAKNQKTEFTYDALKRVTAIKRFVNTSGVWVEQPCQEVSYTYDSGSGSNLAGRLAKVTAKQCDTNISQYEELFSYESSGLLQHRDSVWTRSGSTLTRRVDPTFNQLGLLTNFGYGATGSLYSYAYTYDNAWRPATMTGESLTLVNGVTYNAAGAMTAFTRNDGSGTAVNNSYTFNHLFQLTNQTVTKGGATLQNLTYSFSSTQNNGQILSQIDAVSGETVEYAYDSLNRLLTAATTGPQWGLSFTYDGFGNRTNQSVTKGSGPTHSVAIDPATNRISTSGYQYDPNGNMTQMPQLTMSYDVANRMTTSNHASAGTQSYGYNHANQRVFVRNGNTVTYYLYGLGGERLMEFQETCTSGACTSYTETQRWIYFAGRKMFSKTGSTLKAITPNRLASEAKHFPYGETDGTPPGDTKDYFATYRRDGTGLDYAWNRYYSPTMGRFTTADPGPYDYMKPERLNLYVYSGNNPVNLHDPNGRFWKELFGAIAGFFGGGQRDREPALGSGGGNDQAEPDEGVVGAEGADGGGWCIADPQTGSVIDANGDACFSSSTTLHEPNGTEATALNGPNDENPISQADHLNANWLSITIPVINVPMPIIGVDIDLLDSPSLPDRCISVGLAAGVGVGGVAAGQIVATNADGLGAFSGEGWGISTPLGNAYFSPNPSGLTYAIGAGAGLSGVSVTTPSITYCNSTSTYGNVAPYAAP
jgi:RHS repeat-associated protein